MGLDKAFWKKAVVKISVIAILLLININIMKSAASDLYEQMTWKSDASRTSMYDRHLNDGDYNRLRSSMLLFDSYGEIFDPYWEIVDGYEYLNEYKVWHRAHQELEEPDGKYELRMNESKDKLLKLCENSRFERNSAVLESFAAQTGE